MLRVVRWPFSEARRRRLDVRDIQGDILRAYSMPVSAHLFVGVPSPEAGRQLLEATRGRVTTGQTWTSKPDSTLNVGITYTGLTALGAPDELLASFPPAFREGMRHRAPLLGDVDDAHPDHWDDGLGSGAAHLLFTVNALDDERLSIAVGELEASIDACAATVVCTHLGRRLPDRKEHFGYADGVGQPAIEGVGDPVRGQGDQGVLRSWHGLPLGEIFHGFVDDNGDPSPGPAPPFHVGGTFKVWRKLYEDVASFRTWVAGQADALGMDEELLRAKLVGRWSDASPLALAPDAPDPRLGSDPELVNDFDYSDDPHGERCPFGAHIRRANPRSGLGFGDALTSRQRIIRRGMPYGEPLPPEADGDDGVDRGIYFVAYMADIERQFEFIQSTWMNDGDAVNAGHDRDPFVGRAAGDHKFVIPGPVPKIVHPLVQPVTTKGGEYLWVPSITSLARIAAARWTLDEPAPPTQPEPDRPPDSPAPVVWEPVGSSLGALLAPIAATAAFLTGRRVVHPVGVSFDADLEVFDPPLPLLDDTVLGRPGRREAIVRLSRGYGRPLDRRDVHGFALRLPDADGAGGDQDLLLATVRRGLLGRDATGFTDRYGPTFSTMLRLRVPSGRTVLFKARPRQAMPGDGTIHTGGGTGLRFDLCVGESPDDVRVLGTITLGEARTAEETRRLAFSVGRAAGGIRPAGVLNTTRTLVYPASHLGRSLRNRRRPDAP